MTWKQVECPFEEDRAILHYLHTAPIFSEDGEKLFIYTKADRPLVLIFQPLEFKMIYLMFDVPESERTTLRDPDYCLTDIYLIVL